MDGYLIINHNFKFTSVKLKPQFSASFTLICQKNQFLTGGVTSTEISKYSTNFDEPKFMEKNVN